MNYRAHISQALSDLITRGPSCCGSTDNLHTEYRLILTIPSFHNSMMDAYIFNYKLTLRVLYSHMEVNVQENLKMQLGSN